MKKALYLTVLAGFALFGCMPDNTAPDPVGPKGSARIKLPQLPDTFLKTGPAAEYALSVTVSGPGMAPITHGWKLSEFGGKTVAFEGIPAGNNRVFTGILMRGMAKTHEGAYTVNIGGGESVFVPLVLRDVGTGRAEICVEVDGWPGSLNCNPIDTLPVDTFALSGCWHIEANEGATRLNGTLSFIGMEGSVYGQFTPDAGEPLWANAEFVNGAWRITLHPRVMIDDMGDSVVLDPRYLLNIEKPYGDAVDTVWYRTYQFRIDTFSFGPADQPNGTFWGVTMDPSFQKVLGKVTGFVTPCITPTPIGVDTTICIFPRPEPMIK